MWITLNGKGNLDKTLILGFIKLYPLWFSVEKINENFHKL